MRLTETQKARAWDELNDFISYLQKMKTLFNFDHSTAELDSLTDVANKIERKVLQEAHSVNP